MDTRLWRLSLWRLLELIAHIFAAAAAETDEDSMRSSRAVQQNTSLESYC
jgi:hypothetical protein